MTQSTSEAADPADNETLAPASRGRPRFGRAFQVAGVAGFVVCLVLVLGVWLGRAWAVTQVDGVVGSLDAGLMRAGAAATEASGEIDKVAAGMGDVASVADQAANGSITVPPEVSQAIGTRLSAAADRYRSFRAAYGNLREQVVSVVDTLQSIDRFIPGISVPQGPIDALANLDERVQALDSSVTELVTLANGAGTGRDAAAQLASQAADTQATLTDASSLVQSVTDTTDALQREVNDAGSTANLLFTIIAIVFTLVILYVAALNVALWALGGRWRSG